MKIFFTNEWISWNEMQGLPISIKNGDKIKIFFMF
jgi:hypothetical protein